MSEYSARESKPVWLVKIFDGTILEYCLTNSQISIFYDGKSYTPALIMVGGYEVNPETEDNLELKIGTSEEIIGKTFIRFQQLRLRIEIVKAHKTDVGYEFYGYFQGLILNFEYETDISTAICVNELYLLNKAVVKEQVSYQCRHRLYSADCGATPIIGDWTITQKYSDTKWKVDRPPIGSTYALGVGSIIEIPYSDANPSVLEKRSIIEASGDGFTMDITVSRSFMNPNIITGRVVKIYRHCDHTIEDCKNVFNRIPSFGGFRYVRKSPYVDYNGDEETPSFARITEEYEAI